jgi:sugar/nucleoside kinase (ribokinase family)
MLARRGFVTGGTWCGDRTKIVDVWPSEHGVAEIPKVDKRGGGSACNFAVDTRRLDLTTPVETVELVGDDEDGRFLLTKADAAGIDRRQRRVEPELTTNYSDAFVSSHSGRRTHIFQAGSSAHLHPDHLDLAETCARILHLGLPGVHHMLGPPYARDVNGWVTVLKKARSTGLHTNLKLVSTEPARIASITRLCLPLLDYLIVNDFDVGESCKIGRTRLRK